MTATTSAAPQPLYSLWPKQAMAADALGLRALNDPTSRTWAVEELLYGGQAGGGKSHLVRAIGATICLSWAGAVVVIFRRTYPELEDSHIRWVQQEVVPPVATYSVQRRELRFFNGSSLLFRHADDEAAITSYLTAEWAALLIDQAEQFSEYQIRMLRSRVRQPSTAFGGCWRPIIVYSANPGGPSHQYLRDGFVEAAAAETVFQAPESDGGLRRFYLPARLADNPSLDADQYRRILRGLPEHLQRAYLEGDWSVITGAYFTQWRATDLDGKPWHVWPEAFAREHYGVKVDEPFPPKEWVKWAGLDLGVRDPFACEFLTRAPNRRLFVYRELYAAGVQVPQQARLIRRVLGEHDEHLARILADPAGFANRANQSVSDAQIYAREGVPLTRGNNKREQGWRRVGELLDETLDDGYPALVVLEGKAPNLVRTLPILLADPLHPEDVSQDRKVHALSHAPDALRYGVTPAAAPPAEVVTSPIRARWGPDDDDDEAGVGDGRPDDVYERRYRERMEREEDEARGYLLAPTGVTSDW